jgi:hypothetical protein
LYFGLLQFALAVLTRHAGQLDDAGGINLPRSDLRAIKSQLSANELEKIRRRREPYFRSARNHMRRFAVVFALRSM